MKTPTTRAIWATRTKRGFGQIVLALLFLLSIFQLSHLPNIAADHSVLDLWRGLAAGSLFLFFCPGRSHSGL
jgi:hypothetical protein